MNSSLRQSEWILVLSLLIIMASLLVISRVNASRSAALLGGRPPPSAELYPVVITGAAKKPGTYPAYPGTPLKKVVQKSLPNRFADLRKIDLEQKVEGPMAIELTLLQEITVRIEGEVEAPIELTLPIGARMSELKSKVVLTERADQSVFKSRRMLKDGEIVMVRKK